MQNRVGRIASITLNISGAWTKINIEKKRVIYLTNFVTGLIFMAFGSTNGGPGLLTNAGKEYDSRTALRLGGSSPHVLIVVDVKDIRNIQFF